MSTTNRVAAFLQCFKWGVSTTHVWQLQHASPQKERKVKYLILAVGCYGYIIKHIILYIYIIIYIYMCVCVSIFWGVTKGDSLGLVGGFPGFPVSRSSRLQPLSWLKVHQRKMESSWRFKMGEEAGPGAQPGAQKRWVGKNPKMQQIPSGNLT